MEARRLLEIYLADHFAGSTGGTSLARRIAGNNRGNEVGREMEEIADAIEEDRRSLEDIMQRVGARRSRLKELGAGVGERLGRIKANGRLTGYSPLSRVLELEGMIMGVTGKLELWRSLREVAPRDPRLNGERLSALERRAEDQRSRLERLHASAAREALAAPEQASRG